MASTEQQLRRELHDEREQLAEAVGTLRAKLRSKLPLLVEPEEARGEIARMKAAARTLLNRVFVETRL